MVALATLLAATGCTRGDSAKPDLSQGIPIGAAIAQTSNASLFGQEQIAGLRAAETYFNQRGGVASTKLRTVFQDVAGDEQGAINAFNQLIGGDRVVAIIGPTLSQQAFAADPLAERAGVPVVSASNTAIGIPQIGQFISRVSPPSTTLAPNSVEAILRENPRIRRVAVFFAQNDATARSETEVFQKTVRDRGLDLVTVQRIQTTDTDFQTQVTAALNSRPDLVIISALAVDGGNLVRQLRQLGYRGPIVAGNGLNTPNIFPVCQRDCDGLTIAQAYSPVLDTPINREFRQGYQQRNPGQEPPQLSAQAFAAFQVITESLQRLNRRTPLAQLSLSQLRQDLNKEILAGTYDTPVGQIRFTPEGEVVQQQFYVARVRMNPDGRSGRFTMLPTSR